MSSYNFLSNLIHNVQANDWRKSRFNTFITHPLCFLTAYKSYDVLPVQAGTSDYKTRPILLTDPSIAMNQPSRAEVAKPLARGQKSARQDIFKRSLKFFENKFVKFYGELCNT